MGNPITIFRGSMGLNTKTDPHRIPFNPETGLQDLAVAVNVDHDRTGRISRRKGFSQTIVQVPCHSLWSEGGTCLFVSGSTMYLLGKDYLRRAVTTVTPSAQVSYTLIDNRVYWVNGYEKGFIENGVNYDWVRGDYVGPETTRQFFDPPVGHIVCYWNGHIWIAEGPVIWFSDTYDLNAFELEHGVLPFESRIAMLHPVKDGIYISDQHITYFADGPNPDEMNLRPVTDYPAIEGTDVTLDMRKFGDGTFPGTGVISPGVIWTSPQGIVVGAYNGMILNLTSQKIKYPSALRGAGICFDDRYITTLEP